MASYQSMRKLREMAQGTDPAGRTAFARLVWFERGRRHRATGVFLSNRQLLAHGPLAREAYLEGFLEERNPIGSHRSRKPMPLRAGSAEVRA